MSSKVIKLTWSEVAEMVRTELRKIIGRDVFCVAKSDDDTYWDISFPLERLPLSDLHCIKNRTVLLFRCSNVVRAARSKILAAFFHKYSKSKYSFVSDSSRPFAAD